MHGGSSLITHAVILTLNKKKPSTGEKGGENATEKKHNSIPLLFSSSHDRVPELKAFDHSKNSYIILIHMYV